VISLRIVWPKQMKPWPMQLVDADTGVDYARECLQLTVHAEAWGPVWAEVVATEVPE
jgi:hypothetical protein